MNSSGSSRFSVWPVFGRTARPAARQGLLEEEAGLQAMVVLVADHDQGRHGHGGDLRLQIVERRTARLNAAHRVGGADVGMGREPVGEGAASRAGPCSGIAPRLAPEA